MDITPMETAIMAAYDYVMEREPERVKEFDPETLELVTELVEGIKINE